MSGKGYIDLHCHYLPAIDDGVKTMEEGLALCQQLHRIGYSKVVATPHIRSDIWPNRREPLQRLFAEFENFASKSQDPIPELGLAAEHFCDDIFWRLIGEQQALPYPGGHAALIEFSTDRLPVNVAEMFFRINVKGIRPVLAHPERYKPLFRHTDPISQLLEMGTLPLLDLMSLAGKYGRKPKNAAHRMLEEDVYYAACSDCHCPDDVKRVQQAIEILDQDFGPQRVAQLLIHGPQQILDGSF